MPDDAAAGSFAWELPHGIELHLHRYDDDAFRFNSATVEAIPEFHTRALEAAAPTPTPAPTAPEQPAANGEPAAAPAPQVSGAPAPDPHLRSPRATIQTFLDGMARWEDGGREAAIKTLDLSGVRDLGGETAAYLLNEILIRFPDIVPQEIPNHQEGPSYEHKLVLPYDEDRIYGSLVIAPLATGEWKFSQATVESLRELHANTEHLPIISEAVPVRMPVSLQLRNWVRNSAPFMLHRSMLLENWQWLGLFAIILVGMAFSRGFTWLLAVGLRGWFRRAKLELDRDLERHFVRPVRIAIMAWVWFLGLSTL